MKRNPLFIVIMVVALVSMACGVRFNLPVVEVKTGPTVTEDILVSELDDSNATARVTLTFGAGEIDLNPGAENALISGTASYNVADFKPTVKIDGNDIRLEQGDLEINGIPNFEKNIINEWNLKLSQAPMELRINAGGYKANYEFGGLSIQDLEIADGAANVNLSFSKPNLVEMDTFRYITGASNITLSNLANANADTMLIQSGAGNYEVDFSGELKRDLDVRIESGFSSVKVIVPRGMNAVLEIEGGLSNVNLRGDWERVGDGYRLAGEGSTIHFIVKMGAGTLRLDN